MGELTDGYLFAFHVLNCMGVDFDSDAVKKCVREVADGSRVLRNSPEDDLENIERNKGSRIEEPERSQLLNHHRDHCKQIDAKNVAIAKQLIAEWPR